MAGASSSAACSLLPRCPAPLEALPRPLKPRQPGRHPQRSQADVPLRRRSPCRLSVAAAAAGPHSNAVSYHRSREVLGVVILDQGPTSLECSALLAEFAAAYRQEHGRAVVAVASAASLERAARSCIAQGANKIMVVPYCLSPSRLQEGDLLTALAETQRRLPGVRLVTGETIPVASILAQHIENQVKVVEVKPVDVPERYWRPDQLPPSSPAAQRSAASGARPAGRAPGAVAQQGRRQADVSGAWGSAAAASAAAVWSDDVALACIDRAAPAPPHGSSSGSGSREARPPPVAAAAGAGSGWAALVGNGRQGAPVAAAQGGSLGREDGGVAGVPAVQPGQAQGQGAQGLERRLESVEEQLRALTSLLKERVELSPPPPPLAVATPAAAPAAPPRRHPAAAYQHVTFEEAATLSPAQCEFLERKRSRRGI